MFSQAVVLHIYEMELRVLLLIDYLPLKARSYSLPCHLFHNWNTKRWIPIFPKIIRANVNVVKEFILDSSFQFSALMTVTLHAHSQKLYLLLKHLIFPFCIYTLQEEPNFYVPNSKYIWSTKKTNWQ